MDLSSKNTKKVLFYISFTLILMWAQDKTPKDFSLVKRLEAVDWEGLKERLIHVVKDSWKAWAGNTFSFVSTVIGKLVTFGLAFVFSAYALLEKEKLIVQTKKLILAYLPRKSAERVFHIGDLSNEAFIGFGLGFLLILVVDTKMALWFIILFVALYQIEGNLIYPFVVGKASNLSSIWIFVAGIIGGSVGGLAGILLSIPIFSVLYTLLNESINRRLKAKGIKKIE